MFVCSTAHRRAITFSHSKQIKNVNNETNTCVLQFKIEICNYGFYN